MARPPRNSKPNQASKPKRARSWRLPVTVVLLVVVVLVLSYQIYRRFGVTDAQGWLSDVALIFAVIVLAVLAAAAVVAVSMAVRKRRMKDRFW